MAKLSIRDFQPFEGCNIRMDNVSYVVQIKKSKYSTDVILFPTEGKCAIWPIEVLHGDVYFAEQVLQELHNTN